MLEIIIEIFLGFLIEFLYNIFVEVLLEFGFESFRHSFKRRKEANKTLSLIGYFLLGGLLGLISIWILPKRIIQIQILPGLSLLIVPFLVGFVMAKLGKYRIKKGATITNLATYWGGVSFAFGMSLIRFLFFLQTA